MSIFVIGDLHGCYSEYQRLLREAGLTDVHGHWTAGDHQLWLIGDIFDRGESGIECLELTMALQNEARIHSGDVNALLGNHEMMILCAWRFRNALTSAGMRVIDQWRAWGGVLSDLGRLTERHVAWLEALPAMVVLGDDTLLLHADAMFYVEHGRTPAEVNESLHGVLRSEQLYRWENTLLSFSEHRAFSAAGTAGAHKAAQMARYFGVQRLVHGHTPIPLARREPAYRAVEAWTYASGRCVNVDGGLYLGGPGFVHQLE